jgi:hypothetical protein
MSYAGTSYGFGTPAFYPSAQQAYWQPQFAQAGGGFGINPLAATQQIVQLLHVIPQQLQQLQAMQQQQLLHLQQLLQLVPAQLQQLQQLIQTVPQQVQHLQQQPIAPTLSSPAFTSQLFAPVSGHLM